MTNHDITKLAFKILCIYAFIRAIELSTKVIPYFYDYYEEAGQESVWVGIQILLPPILLIVGGIILWVTAPALSKIIFRTSDLPDQQNLSFIELQTIAFSVVGLIILIDALPYLIKSIIALYMFKAYSISDKRSIIERNTLLIFALIKTAIGFWLLLGSRGIVKLIKSAHKD